MDLRFSTTTTGVWTDTEHDDILRFLFMEVVWGVLDGPAYTRFRHASVEMRNGRGNVARRSHTEGTSTKVAGG